MPVSIDKVRNIEWSRSYLWDVKFPDAPAPFNDWFPAIDVELNLATLNSYEFQGGASTYKVPQLSSAFDLKITYVDDINDSLTRWISDWINADILSENNTLKPLKQIVKMVQIMTLDLDRTPLHVYSLWVYPEGSIYFHGDSNADPHTYTVDFVIVGKAKTTH